jgi:phage/plasmid-like protein (TIGR03299 family)
MAHLIENNELAYTGEVPWHGIGTPVAEGTSGLEMLKVAGLDWEIQKRKIAVSTGPKGSTKFDPKPVEDFVAITRSDNGRVFHVATQKYQPVQNRQIADFFREYCEAGKAHLETIGAVRGGATIWALAKLKGGDKIIGGNDKLTGYLLLCTSHDGSLATVGRPTQVRVVCNNTLTAALRGKAGEQSFRLLHNTKFTKERREEAQRLMGLAIEQIDATNDLAEQLSKISIDESAWLEFMGKLLGGADEVLNPKTAELTRTARLIQEATVNSPGADLESAKGTLWGAVNGVTYYADHTRGFSTTTQESRLTAAWFGAGNSLKNKAVEAACEIGGIELVTVGR